MFVAMSAISVYFLCPTMTDICKNYLNLNESVAGVTLMAFANGSNDFFSCASAFMSNQGSLALSELIGAGDEFILTIDFESQMIMSTFL